MACFSNIFKKLSYPAEKACAEYNMDTDKT